MPLKLAKQVKLSKPRQVASVSMVNAGDEPLKIYGLSFLCDGIGGHEVSLL